MGDWFYVVLAYAVVWGAVATYALVLQRRIAQARAGAERMRQAIDERGSTVGREDPACEAPSVP